MKIYNVSQIREWDQHTILNEPISSLSLMERAAAKCFDWLMANGYRSRSFTIFCGPGNNGGDGLVIARLLLESSHAVKVYVFETDGNGTEDFDANLGKYNALDGQLLFIKADTNLQLDDSDVVIDAIFGSGLSRQPAGIFAETIDKINKSGSEVISIDLPSGMFADQSSVSNFRINAIHTLTFQASKLAFMMSENEASTGTVQILDIGLAKDFEPVTGFETIDHQLASALYKKRSSSGHKGTYGHSLIIAGSYGKMGAALLSTRACLRGGSGLVTAHVPLCGYEIMQAAAPEAMTEVDQNEKYISRINGGLDKFSAIAVGPGIGQEQATLRSVREVIGDFDKPMVVDADALNLLSETQELLARLPALSIITPHPKEFERLFGKTA
ncbi:MAG: NAD(P)H-hydrate epimerase, partial [Flavitalea sp.]